MKPKRTPNVQSAAVTRRADTIFIPLPRELWRPIREGCRCTHCARTKSKRAFWDTLAVAAVAPSGGRDITWTVHYPELHAPQPRRILAGACEHCRAPLYVGELHVCARSAA